MRLPLLFLDVDGPLNPYAAQPERRPAGYTTIRVPRNNGSPDESLGLTGRRHPLRVWLHPGPGLLHHVNPRIGLREDDFRTLSDFARSLAAPPPAG
ncbi:hypothetical protein [Streptomyces arboris]|uniref:Uncharacterized protein n=1 Tax=Streptomyces arboris TaxID=2600619 RepID=A0A5N5EXQ6_9ACTN|nr:hypothetical protein [Streptomyces arboris]KAB2593650.1 hypothetical protein F5983_05060 [Streptomyces arboris]